MTKNKNVKIKTGQSIMMDKRKVKNKYVNEGKELVNMRSRKVKSKTV